MQRAKCLKIGQYVLVTKWADKDPQDPWCIGYINEITIREGGVTCKVECSYRKWKNREWNNIFLITEEEGREWLEANQSFM